MGSRIGSIAILLVIAAIIAVVAFLIIRLDLLNTGDPDAPLMVLTLDEDELVLLEEAKSITVTIWSGNPIATLELVVDNESVVSVLPAYSTERGAWIGTFVWVPQRLGFADVQIVALDDQGVESTRQVRVEVTDDQARVAAALRVQILGISPLQQFISGSIIPLAISATGSQPIERFDMFVDGDLKASIAPLQNEDGQYIAAIDWLARNIGETEVTITAVDTTGRSESKTITIVLLSQDTPTLAAAAESQSDQPQGSEEGEGPDSSEDVDGSARFAFPEDGQQFSFDNEFTLDIELNAANVGAIDSVLLYITPIAPDNTLGNSVLIFSDEGQSSGDYQERVEDVERWITSSGSYELQLVVFTPDEERYDDRIVIHVVAVAEDDEDDDSTEDQALSDEIDLAIVTARQTDDASRLNVSITNRSTSDIERISLLLTVADATTGIELASASVTLGIESEALRSIPLDLDLQPGESIDALVVLESLADTDTSNNTLDITLVGPEADQSGADAQPGQPDAGDDAPGQSTTAPDLTVLDAQWASDGYVLVTVFNRGDAPAASFSILVSDEAGEQLELISRRSNASPLAPGETEILTSFDAHAGVIVLTILVDDPVGDPDPSNNSVTIELPN